MIIQAGSHTPLCGQRMDLLPGDSTENTKSYIPQLDTVIDILTASS